jgi:crossover junction endodeoxyribonuclease RusA
MSITLPWPPRDLHPNSRPHHMAKAKATKIYRDQAYWLTRKDGPQFLPDHMLEASRPILLDITFYPPDRRRRDLDGMLSSVKAGLDGLADALTVNDQRFEFRLRRAEPEKPGKVIISIMEAR